MPTVLFVDDNKNVREFCKRHLEREGYRVILGAGGHAALAVLRQELPDLVVMDVRMSRMDGFEAIDQIAARHPGLPVILYIESRGYLDDERSRLAAACVEKSEDLSELKAAIALVLSQRQTGNPFLRRGVEP